MVGNFKNSNYKLFFLYSREWYNLWGTGDRNSRRKIEVWGKRTMENVEALAFVSFKISVIFRFYQIHLKE